MRNRYERAVTRRLIASVWMTCIWAALVLAETRDVLIEFLYGGEHLRARSAAQGLVEWSLAAAVLALVGLGAWQLAGAAITDAINRTIGSLNRAGV